MQVRISRILVTGAGGRFGWHLVTALRRKHGTAMVIAADLAGKLKGITEGPCRELDVLNPDSLHNLVRKEQVGTVYHLAGCLPAEAEKDPATAYQLNVGGLLNVLNAARDYQLKVFWPGSIAVFGNDSPKSACPQDSPNRPDTVYGICKSAGEGWCRYYHKIYGVDVRAIRFPAIICPGAEARGGTLDYLAEVFASALHTRTYTCYLKPHTRMPVIYIDDAVRAAMMLMASDRKKLSVPDAYNISAACFSPQELEQAIQAQLPAFKMHYRPDARQLRAERWPASLEDTAARQDWKWQPGFDLAAMVEVMLKAQEQRLENNTTGRYIPADQQAN